MIAKSTRLAGLLLAVPMLAVPAFAHADAPVVSPQWTTSFWRDEPATDPMASSIGPTWLRLPDGSTALFTTPGGLLFRRFAADGSVVHTARLDAQQAGVPPGGIGGVMIEADPLDGGFHLLIGPAQGFNGCWLLHTDAQFQVQWSINAPGFTGYADPCVGLHALDDGSVLVLRESTLARIDSAGQTLWSKGLPDGAPLGARAFAVDAQDVIWVVGGWDNHATVTRYTMAGEQISADALLCTTCIASTAQAIDILPSGDVLVGGGSGSFQPGFLVRYDASGARRLWVDTEIDVNYSRITHDESGAVYVRVGSLHGIEAREIRRVDPASGAVQWAIEADDFGARAQGIITLHKQAAGLLAVGIDATGAETWSTLLSPNQTATFSRPFARAGDRTELLVQEPITTSSPACGNSPRLLTLDAAGAIADELQACMQPVSKWLQAIDALPEVGALANLGSELVAFHPTGDERWRALACTACMPGSASPRWVVAALTDDGGAWAVRKETMPSGIETRLERIGADGQIAFAVPAAAGAWSNPAIRLFVEPDRVIALTMATQRLVWQAVGLDGSPLGTHEVSMPDDDFDIRAARLNADGSLTIVALGRIVCTVGCNPFHLSVLRITAEGAPAWRHDFYYVDWPAMPMPDGGVLMVLADSTNGSELAMQRYDAQGVAQAPIALVGVTPNSSAEAVSGPVDGRWLLQTRSYANDEHTSWSIGEDGQVGASRGEEWYPPRVFGSSGYLVPVSTPAGVRMQLLDAVTLQTRATLPFGTSGDDAFDYGPWHWRMLDDDTIYGTWLSPNQRLGLARYALPWGAPQDRLFRNGFD